MRFSALWTRFALSSLALLVLAGLAAGDHAYKHSKDCRRDPKRLVDVIIRFAETPSPGHPDKTRAKSSTLETKLSGIRKGSQYRLSDKWLAELSADLEVASISSERPVQRQLDATTDMEATPITIQGEN